MAEENLTPVEGLIQFGEELINDFEGVINSESNLKEAIDHELQEAQEVEQEEDQEIELEFEMEKDIEGIKSDLDEINSDLSKLSRSISEGGLSGSTKTVIKSFENTVLNDIKEVEGFVSNIERDLDMMKDFQKEEIENIKVETEEFDATHQALKVAKGEVGQVDEMADSFLSTVNSAEANGALAGENAQRLEQMKERVNNLRETLEQRLKGLMEEDSQVQQEMSKEEELIRKELGLEEELLNELETEINEVDQEDKELVKIENWLEGHGDEDDAKVIDKFRTELENIENHLGSIHQHIEEMADMAMQEENMIDEEIDRN